MFDVYIDDSGTAPDQRIAVASALIVPARRVLALGSEWNTFCSKYEILDFHASECAALNRRSQYAEWDGAKASRAFARVRQITKKYASKAISFAVTKAEFDREIPDKWKDFVGRDHYVWAIWHLLKMLRMWSEESPSRGKIEYVFDMLQGKSRKAVENALGHMETIYPNFYAGHYSFRKRVDWPGLQCVDLLAWASYCAARCTFEGSAINRLADETIREYRAVDEGNWMVGLAVRKGELRRVARKYLQ